MVAVHEIGHALGLAHSNSTGSVMLPFYQNYHENTRLGADDAEAIFNLYGTSSTRHAFVGIRREVLVPWSFSK